MKSRLSARMLPGVLLGVGIAGCAGTAVLPRPLPVQSSYVHREVAARYGAFFPPDAPTPGEPQAPADPGVLRPRFGLPALAQVGAAFPVHLLVHDGAPDAASAADAVDGPVGALVSADQPLSPEALARCLAEPNAPDLAVGLAAGLAPVPGCVPLRLRPASREPVSEGTAVAVYQAEPQGPGAALLKPGGYDLYVQARGAAPGSGSHLPRAVWLRAEDPEAATAVRVVHLSDLHVGKRIRDERDLLLRPAEDLLMARLRRVVAAVNAERPDLVVVTGDIVNRGQDPALAPRAQALLLGIGAPLLVVMGNHDIEHDLRKPSPKTYGVGWSNFARAFHPYLHYQLRLGAYDFVGFDSGPSERSPRVLTRGLSAATLDQLATDVRDAAAADSGARGVVLFSHAPTRAATFGRIRPLGPGFFGRMRHGHAALEGILLAAAQRGQRTLHLAGHTHWSDVFEATPQRGRLRFTRWPSGSLSPCPRPIHGRAALVTTQAAAHAGVFFKDNARGYGYSVLTLGADPDEDPTVAVRRFGVPQRPARCPAPAGSSLDPSPLRTATLGAPVVR